MKRMKGIFILAILSLFLGVTSVTSYAESGSVSVETGIRFLDESSGNSENESGLINNSDSPNSTGEEKLPQTGEKPSLLLNLLGSTFLVIFFAITKNYPETKNE